MHPRRKIGFFFLIIIGVVLGFAIKNIEIGLVLGLAIGLLAASLVGKSKQQD
jgi:hypothetical protein